MTRAAPAVPLLALVLALAGSPRVASAGREVGRLAPELDATEAWNAPAVPFTLRSLRGRMVVLEFFSVDCPHCQAAVAGLNAIQRERFEQGVRVVGASRQPAGRIAEFVRERRVSFPVVRVPSEILEDYAVAGYPEAFVIGGDGRVLWTGDPRSLSAATLDRLRGAAAPWTALADSVRGGAAVLRGDDATGARRVLEPCTSDAGICSPDQAAAADAMLAWIDAWAATLDAVATAEVARREPYEAWKALDLLARAFSGSPEGKAALARIDALLADPAARREVEAGRALADARRLLAAEDATPAVTALDKVAEAYRGTKAADRAAKIANRYRKRGG